MSEVLGEVSCGLLVGLLGLSYVGVLGLRHVFPIEMLSLLVLEPEKRL